VNVATMLVERRHLCKLRRRSAVAAWVEDLDTLRQRIADDPDRFDEVRVVGDRPGAERGHESAQLAVAAAAPGPEVERAMRSLSDFLASVAAEDRHAPFGTVGVTTSAGGGTGLWARRR
jgi:hypothetical protein